MHQQSLSVAEVADLVGGRLEGGDPGARVIGVAAISEAAEGHVTFLGNRKYISSLRTCGATAAIVPEGFSDAFGGAKIHVENPSMAFARVIERFAPPPVRWTPGVHPTAVVSPEAQLGEGVSIQPFAVIEPGAEIGSGSVVGASSYIGHQTRLGRDCVIYPHVTIRERCIVGSRVIIHSGAVIGSDGFGFEMVEGRHVKIPQVGIVQIDDDVEIGANAAIDRARFGRTWIGEGTKVDNLVQLAHNVVVGKHAIIVSQTGIAGSSKVGNYATLAGQVGVTGHVEIGDQAIVGAQGGVSKNVPPKWVMWGSPAVPMQEAKERLALISRLPRLVERVRKLEERQKGLESTEKSSPNVP